MNVNIPNIIDNLELFLKSINKPDRKRLVSFAFKIDDFDLFSYINPLTSKFHDTFLFRSPDSRYSFLAMNTALKISNKDQTKISDAEVQYNQIKNYFIHNWHELHLDSLPIICTAMKFDPLKTSNDWNDFEPINIFIPEIVLYSNSGNKFGCFNFVQDGELRFEKIRKNLLTQLTLIKELSIKQIPKVLDENEFDFFENENDLGLWLNSAGEAIKILSGDRIQKLVLSRSHSFNLSQEPHWEKLLRKLSQRFPDCYLFYLNKNDSHFFGSSPELFLKIFGKLAEIESVAGSAPRGGKIESDELLAQNLISSKKNHKEHAYVTKFISSTLKNYSDKVIIKEEKSVKKLDNIQHLTTKISAELKSGAQTFETINSLFPTPAVCGLPKHEAMEMIRKLEKHDRGLYSGLIGWIDFEGNCELAVAIRSTLVKKNKVTAYAGAGLVKDSNPKEEFLETNLKLDPILSLFKQQ